VLDRARSRFCDRGLQDVKSLKTATKPVDVQGLSPSQIGLLRKLTQHHDRGEHALVALYLSELIIQAPEHPEVLYWQARELVDTGEWTRAIALLIRAAALRPEEVRIWLALSAAQAGANDHGAAHRSLQRAMACARATADWHAITLEADRQGHVAEALQAASALLRLEPRSVFGLLQRSRCARALGHAEQAAADCRTLIAMNQELARAWFALVELKTVALTARELQALEATVQRNPASGWERHMLAFAWAKTLEDAGRWAEALAAFHQANQSVRASLPWSPAALSGRVAAIDEALGQHGPASDRAQGREVIFLVGLPRSGSTLIEQVLAAHPMVEGASELPYLQQVLDAESRRRGRPFPAWATEARSDDWTRLGQHYLELSARWRQTRPIATDKLPGNWIYIGAIRRMLPEARVIHCRRDPLETCWSCYKQLFGQGLAGFSYDFASLAQYSKACEQHADAWMARDPERVRIQHYEALVSAPNAEIPQLLAFCGLPFDAACMAAHTADRAIRTPSALQVRQPMRKVSRVVDAYGELLHPLRELLRDGS
jgi:tetratricopeptide (TPR) repeat protein